MVSIQNVAHYIQSFALFFYLTIYPGGYFTSTGPDLPPKGRVNVDNEFVAEKKKSRPTNNNILKSQYSSLQLRET